VAFVGAFAFAAVAVAAAARPGTSADGHSGASVHVSQAGFLAKHTRRPCQIS
jgi:hypothetical protein